MSTDEIFDVWCPPSGRWSPWVKPVLFSFVSSWSGDTRFRGPSVAAPIPAEPPPAWDLAGLPKAAEDTAMVLDLPEGEAVRLGMTFVLMGFRPVPLYNAMPWEEGSEYLLMHEHCPVVEMVGIVQALRSATPQLVLAKLPDDAPPVFMLDANRRHGRWSAPPGAFDNRSICFSTDFPSANFLLAHGITRVILVQRDRNEPQEDLAHILRQWQDGDIRLELKRLDHPAEPRPLEVRQPKWYRLFFYRASQLLRFRTSAMGGFGGIVPEPSSG